jgi:beta-glucosidase
LPLSFPERLHNNPTYLSFRSEAGRVLYSEDVYVGYRYYDKVGVSPLFRFGHGLSYTSFQLSGVTISQSDEGKNIKDEVIVGNASVENVGSRAGAEVIQLYVLPPQTSRVGRPLKELKGFQKVMLQPGEKKQVTIIVPKTLATSYWDEQHTAWMSEAGDYRVAVVGTGDGNNFQGQFKVHTSRRWNGL